MKKPIFAILALCFFTVGLVGCGGNESEIPDGYTEADKETRTPDPVKSPSAGVGETSKGN